jgi:glycosyltransferase involved in cell wall biosynthesis
VRVFFVTEYFWPDVGGLEQSIFVLARAVGRHVPVTILAPVRAEHFTEREGVSVTRVGSPTTPFHGGVKAYLKAHARPNDVVCVFGFSPTCLRDQMAFLEFAREALSLRLLFKVPSLGEFSEALPYGPLLRGLLAVDHILCLNEAIADELVRGGIPRTRCVSFRNGVDTMWFRPPQRSEREAARSAFALGEEIVCSFVGRFVLRKRLDVLIEAAACLDDVHILLVGYEDTRFEPPLGVDRYCGERVRRIFPGTNVLPAYFASDVYVSASEQEGLPNAMLEAMATGLPVVASDIPGHRELVDHGANGALFDPSDVCAMGHHLRGMRDEAYRRALGARSRNVVLDSYAAESVADRFLRLVS